MAFNHVGLCEINWKAKRVRLQRLRDKLEEERLRTLFRAACHAFNFHLDKGWSESTNRYGDYINLLGLSSAGFASGVRDLYFLSMVFRLSINRWAYIRHSQAGEKT